MLDYFQYVVLWTLVSAVIIYVDKRNATRYIALGLFTVFAALFAEPLGRFAGFWDYSVGPLFFGANVFTILNYFNYMITVYFFSEKFRRRFS